MKCNSDVMLSTKTVNKLYQNKTIEPITAAQKQALVLANKIRTSLEKQFKKSPKHKQRLGGCCVEASLSLFKELRKRRIEAKFIFGYVLYEDGNFWRNQPKNSHCWVEVDGLVLDITATQFLFNQRIFIFPIKEKTKIGYGTKQAYSCLRSLCNKI